MKKTTTAISLMLLISWSALGQPIAYKTVKIGNVEWGTENLRTTKFNNGESIPFAKDSAAWVNAAINKKPAYGVVKKDNRTEYLYNFYVLMDPRGVLPKGYSFPSDSDFMELQDELGKSPASVAKIGLKSVGCNIFYRHNNRFYVVSDRTVFWYRDETSAEMEKTDNMGTSYGLFVEEDCPEKFPTMCDGQFGRFETFYESGGSDAGNAFCVRLIKSKQK